MSPIDGSYSSPYTQYPMGRSRVDELQEVGITSMSDSLIEKGLFALAQTADTLDGWAGSINDQLAVAGRAIDRSGFGVSPPPYLQAGIDGQNQVAFLAEVERFRAGGGSLLSDGIINFLSTSEAGCKVLSRFGEYHDGKATEGEFVAEIAKQIIPAALSKIPYVGRLFSSGAQMVM